MSVMRAEPCAALVLIGICQPCQERALMPMDCSTMASSPAVTCSPVATTASYSRASCSSEASLHPGDELVGDARHGRDDDGDLVAGIDLALDVARDVRMRSTLATDVPPNFITTTAIALPAVRASRMLGNCAFAGAARAETRTGPSAQTASGNQEFRLRARSLNGIPPVPQYPLS